MRAGCAVAALIFPALAFLMSQIAAPRSATQPTATATVFAQSTGSGPDLLEASSGASATPQSAAPRTPHAAPPTARPSRTVLAGVASWYDDGPGLYAAVNSFRFGDKPYRVTIWHEGRHVTVVVRDHCNCYTGTRRERVIDLSPAAFGELAPLDRGLIKVEVKR